MRILNFSTFSIFCIKQKIENLENLNTRIFKFQYFSNLKKFWPTRNLRFSNFSFKQKLENFENLKIRFFIFQPTRNPRFSNFQFFQTFPLSKNLKILKFENAKYNMNVILYIVVGRDYSQINPKGPTYIHIYIEYI